MKVTVEPMPQRQVLLNIEADEEELEHARRYAHQHLAQRAAVPGFRKGKAPLAMVERYVGKAAFLEEALNHLVPEVTAKAIDQEGIQAAGTPAYELTTMEPPQWKATVDLVPEVDLGTYKDIRIAADPVVVTAEEIDKSLEDIRLNLAPWEPIDRLAEMKDLLTVDVTISEGGKQIAKDTGVQFEMDERNTNPVPGFAEQLVGLAKGENKDFEISFQAEAERPELAGKTFQFKVAVLEVKAKNPAPLDDEFAKGVGDGFDSLEALRTNLSEQTRVQKEQEAKSALQEKALQALIDGAKLEYSPGLVTHEAVHIMEDQEDRLRRSKVDMDAYLQSISKTRVQMVAELKPEAERRLKRSLVVNNLIEKEGIGATDEDLDAEVERVVVGTGLGADNLRKALRSESGLRSIRNSLLTKKALDRLVEIATQGEGSEAKKEQAK